MALLEMLLTQEPFADVCLHHFGSFPLSGRGHPYILEIACRFTKIVRAIPIPRDDAEAVLAACFE